MEEDIKLLFNAFYNNISSLSVIRQLLHLGSGQVVFVTMCNFNLDGNVLQNLKG